MVLYIVGEALKGGAYITSASSDRSIQIRDAGTGTGTAIGKPLEGPQ
jgi:hypothetical protein